MQKFIDLRKTLALISIFGAGLACGVLSPEQVQSTAVAETLTAFDAGTQQAVQLATDVAGTVTAAGGGASEGEGTPESGTTGGDPTAMPENTPEPGSFSRAGIARPVDFNGDGFQDLVVGLTGYNRDDGFGHSGFYIFQGSGQGLRGENVQLWLADDFIPAAYLDKYPATTINFSSHIEAADFNGDGYSDLALGWPQRSGLVGGGDVFVLYGSDSGLRASSFELWNQDGRSRDGLNLEGDLLGGAETGDGFGETLSAGDFNGDGYHDLAIGAFGEAIGERNDAGAVNIIFGGPEGLSHEGDQLISQDTIIQEQNGETLTLGDTPGGSESNDIFGRRLATGDINGDGFEDLVIGAPGEVIGSDGTSEGALTVLFGSPEGLSPLNNQLLHQAGFYVDEDGDGKPEFSDEEGIPTYDGNIDHFSDALAIGDLNGDGYDDLAVSASLEAIVFADLGAKSTGMVHIIFGGPNGLTLEGNQAWNLRQGFTISGPIPGILPGLPPADRDDFGKHLQAADFNGDGYEDLAIGIPLSAHGELDDVGSAIILYGGPDGPAASNAQFFSQAFVVGPQGQAPGLRSVALEEEYFGSRMTNGDFNSDGIQDLVIKSSQERSGENDEDILGGFFVVFGSSGAGLTPTDHQHKPTCIGECAEHSAAYKCTDPPEPTRFQRPQNRLDQGAQTSDHGRHKDVKVQPARQGLPSVLIAIISMPVKPNITTSPNNIAAATIAIIQRSQVGMDLSPSFFNLASSYSTGSL